MMEDINKADTAADRRNLIQRGTEVSSQGLPQQNRMNSAQVVGNRGVSQVGTGM